MIGRKTKKGMMAQKAPKKEDAAAEKKAQKQVGETVFMYVGPTLPAGVLRKNAVIHGSYETVCECYKNVFATYPLAAKLLVPVANLAQTRQKMNAPNNVINNYYRKLCLAVNNVQEV